MKYDQKYLDESVWYITKILREDFPDEEFTEEKTRAILKENILEFKDY